MPRFQKVHYSGRFVIQTEWLAGLLLYDVTGRSGLPIAAGFDLISGTEQAALDAVKERYRDVRFDSETLRRERIKT